MELERWPSRTDPHDRPRHAAGAFDVAGMAAAGTVALEPPGEPTGADHMTAAACAAALASPSCAIAGEPAGVAPMDASVSGSIAASPAGRAAVFARLEQLARAELGRASAEMPAPVAETDPLQAWIGWDLAAAD